MKLLQALRNIGFTQQEATIYMVLCKNGIITGYEAAKLSGISRSNAYAALSSLVDKGYAHIIEGSSTKYMPIPKNELVKNATRSFNENIATIESELTFNDIPHEAYIAIIGEKPILAKLTNIIEAADKRVYLSCNSNILDKLSPVLNSAIHTGLKVVILAPKDLDQNHHTYYKAESIDSYKVIIDTKEVLAGTLNQSLYSKNTTLVNLIRESFIHEIAVLENGGINA
jgi:sugar-specific transcriptional regulator TrmB